ncbi:hypothetical protein PVAND_008074 [Polypedilum vanderplanki]|uniref:Uncharacterized protein n=1 Tax=Polypedilum vanderplanki TaxID=319348 RepID=A0A9J6C8Z5_POLVA|nr:hypothetical protein PVAND_008074 [Polypedilum vanderplanki]
MKIIDRCPSCLSSSSNDNDIKDAPEKRELKFAKKKLLTPLSIFILGRDNKFNDQREFYSKFYTAPTIQPHLFCHGKKYKIERKHKVKKRDLLNNKRSNVAIKSRELYATSSTATDDDYVDNIKYSRGENE